MYACTDAFFIHIKAVQFKD